MRMPSSRTARPARASRSARSRSASAARTPAAAGAAPSSYGVVTRVRQAAASAARATQRPCAGSVTSKPNGALASSASSRPSRRDQDVDAQQAAAQARDHVLGQRSHRRRRLVDPRVDRARGDQLARPTTLLVGQRGARRASRTAARRPAPRPTPAAAPRRAARRPPPRPSRQARSTARACSSEPTSAMWRAPSQKAGLSTIGRPGSGQRSTAARSCVTGCGSPAAAHTAAVTSLSADASSVRTGFSSRRAGALERRRRPAGSARTRRPPRPGRAR